jgi:Fatty acid desaturase
MPPEYQGNTLFTLSPEKISVFRTDHLLSCGVEMTLTVYLRFFLMPFILVATTAGLVLGGGWMWTGFVLMVVFLVGGDAVMGDDLEVPAYRRVWVLNLSLYSVFPLLLAMLAVLAWMSAGGGDALGLGALALSWTGVDMQAARDATGALDLIGAILSVGLVGATAATNVGHELVHRTHSPFELTLGRWLLAFSCDASFSVEHVYGHHATVGTPRDPATARRGENAWAFVLRSVIGQSKSAWQLERKRLAKRGISVWSWRSRMPRGIAMSAAYFLGVYLIGGGMAVLVFLATTIWARSLLEFVNYIEHYGLVREDDAAVKPHHSWNSNKRVSAFVLYNLTRHSNHHAQSSKPFWLLRPFPEAPTLYFGYLTSIMITMLPPLWHRLMIPKLREWDEHHASPGERALAAAQNAASGLPALIRQDSR